MLDLVRGHFMIKPVIVTEPKPGMVEAKFKIDPHSQDAENERIITYFMVQENNQWVVDNIVSGSWSARQEIQSEINRNKPEETLSGKLK